MYINMYILIYIIITSRTLAVVSAWRSTRGGSAWGRSGTGGGCALPPLPVQLGRDAPHDRDAPVDNEENLQQYPSG